MKTKNLFLFWALLMAGLLGGCASTKPSVQRVQRPGNQHGLSMEKDRPVIDTTTYSKELSSAALKNIMVLPSSSKLSSQDLTLIEEVILSQNLNVVSPAITGRVVHTSPNRVDSKNEGAIGLSPLERVLLLGESAGVDAVLQVDHFEWSDINIYTRYFVLGEGENADFVEVHSGAYHANENVKIKFASPYVEFTGKLINVNDGAILASIDAMLPANYILPDNYQATFLVRGKKIILKKDSETFPYKKSFWENRKKIAEYPWVLLVQNQADQKIVRQVVKELVARSSSKFVK